MRRAPLQIKYAKSIETHFLGVQIKFTGQQWLRIDNGDGDSFSIIYYFDFDFLIKLIYDTNHFNHLNHGSDN
jgi:hypothetical protein